MYVYRRSEPGLWTIGYFTPEGEWVPESDHNDKEEAAKRVVFLNGGKPAPEATDPLSRSGREQKITEILKEFKYGEYLYKRSALFNQVVQSLAGGMTKSEAIEQVVMIVERVNLALADHLIRYSPIKTEKDYYGSTRKSNTD